MIEKGPAAASHDILKIVNSTKEDAVFYIKDTTVFGAGAAQTEVIPKGKSITRQLDNGAAAGSYEYQILMVGSGKKAKGNSDPVIIVEN